ncbi:MAG: pilus assembly protein [Micrococcales bacterium]|nr:pilus assembly protein [Micrococcales bacterium]
MSGTVSRGQPDHSETGAAVVDFAMVSGLVMVVFLAVVQLGFILHVRNTLISCASEGARYGARVDSTPGDGADRTRALIAATLPDSYAQGVSAHQGSAGGVSVVTVEVSSPFPVVGVIGPNGRMHIQGRAFSEAQ